MMQSDWITLYDVTRDGIGFMPWFFLLMWIAGICGAVFALKKSPFDRIFVALWLGAWTLMGGIGLGNVFHQYAANIHALRSGSCETIEGLVSGFHMQDLSVKGDREKFVVSGREFSYSYNNVGGGGLRSSRSFRVPLSDLLYVKIWYRGGTICRLDARVRPTN